MQPKLKLTINEPCHQNWQHMTPTEQGRYCNTCAKEVVDFTAMNDTEVLHYFINKKNEKVCGHMYADQLNRDITKPMYSKKKMMWYWNYFMMLFLLLFKGNIGKGQATLPKQPIEQVYGNDINKMLEGRIGCGVVKGPLFDISGKVTDAEGKPVTGATVMINGTKTGTLTNQEGVYHLKNVTTKEILKVSAVGYISKDIIVNNAFSNDCTLNEAKLGEVVMVGAISYDNDYSPSPIPTHVAVIEVKDNKTSLPVKASISIENDAIAKTKRSITNKKGIYKLRRIKETANYTITISAEGYKDSVLHIKGFNFNERKETKYVFLQKENKQINPAEQRVLLRGGVSSIYTNEPLYIIDGMLTEKETINNIKPYEIESLEILKEPAATALYGSPAYAGVIIITTKKKNEKPAVKDAVEKRKSAGYNDIIAPPINNLKITPNPVTKGNAFSTSFTAKKGSNYVLQVLNASGIVIQSQKVIATAKTNKLQLYAGTNWAAGIYYLRIRDAGNNIIGTGSFIVE